MFVAVKFRWTNRRRRHPIYERLDKGWANPEWLNIFPNANLWHLPRVSSDHCPILLKLSNNMSSRGEKPFRFEPMWLFDGVS